MLTVSQAFERMPGPILIDAQWAPFRVSYGQKSRDLCEPLQVDKVYVQMYNRQEQGEHGVAKNQIRRVQETWSTTHLGIPLVGVSLEDHAIVTLFLSLMYSPWACGRSVSVGTLCPSSAR